MIVVDTDVIAAFWIKGPRTPDAIATLRRDPDWSAPILWRSEFRSVLRQYVLAGHMSAADALQIAESAESAMRGREFIVDTASVLRLVEQTGHSSYDCEFVALAESMGVGLVTGDRKVARIFPEVAVQLEEFAAGGG